MEINQKPNNIVKRSLSYSDNSNKDSPSHFIFLTHCNYLTDVFCVNVYQQGIQGYTNNQIACNNSHDNHIHKG